MAEMKNTCQFRGSSEKPKLGCAPHWAVVVGRYSLGPKGPTILCPHLSPRRPNTSSWAQSPSAACCCPQPTLSPSPMERLKSAVPAELRRAVGEGAAADLPSTTSRLLAFLEALPLFRQVTTSRRSVLRCSSSSPAMGGAARLMVSFAWRVGVRTGHW